jgi:hypothetical protein
VCRTSKDHDLKWRDTGADQDRITQIRRSGIMSQLARALSSSPDRAETYREWLGMYVATLVVASVIILLGRL